MKSVIHGVVLASAIFLFSLAPALRAEELAGTITLTGAWAIYPTAVAWGEAFQKKHPGVKIDVSAGGAGKGAADAIAGLADIGMVSRDPDPSEIKKGVVPVYVLHDAVFPVISDKNPVLKELLKKGVTQKTLNNLYITGIITTWGEVAGVNEPKRTHVYTRSDSCGAAASWAKLFGKKQEDLKGVGVYGDPGLLEAAKRDPLGIGYNNFSFIFTREGNVVPGAVIVPIDANNNGAADADELFDSRAKAVRAIEAGAYPATRKNFFFVKGKPKGIVREFIAFALSDEGAAIADEVGASLPVVKTEREKILKNIE